MAPGGVDQSCRTKTAIIGKLARAATATTMRKAELRASDRGGGAMQVDAGVPNSQQMVLQRGLPGNGTTA